MSYSPILIVAGEPNSIFLEIFFKVISKNKIKSPIILITSKKLLTMQMKVLKFQKEIKILNPLKLNKYKLNNRTINLIDIKYSQKKAFEKISKKSNKFIENCFNLAFKIIKKNKISKFINGPISKKSFLNKKFLGITEYISKHFKVKKSCMLIYNKDLSVCPITTHLPIKLIAKRINKKTIIDKISLITSFYKNKFDINPKIAILGLNPHCESVHGYNEDEKIIKPVIKYLKNRHLVSGPYSADTIFLKKNREKFDVIVGMYHDQVLTPLKTLFEYDAINITLGLPFVRISPDHGPNEIMLGKNKSNSISLLKSIQFLDKN
ncbi:4-hydroxythreonine-4-phosphate dehydrogenase PdxA [Candidatus Pelagibacter sp.]|jgi:4-hydroxythreonine-4-phosphate dehydrogenase|nr:4-hydroxythreonine-4-phosphate dehydrogenase PdxA [Candidatus Pelagibacter sp.]